MRITRILMLPVLLAALTLGGCRWEDFGNAVQFVTSGVANPVSVTNIYQAKLSFNTAEKAVVAYREYCYPAPPKRAFVSYKQLMADPITRVLCKDRRAVMRKAKKAKDDVNLAIFEAQKFVHDNPTLDASAVIDGITRAIDAFRATVPKVQ